MNTLFTFVCSIKTASIATINYNSLVKLPKKYGINGVVEKVVTLQALIGGSYTNAINNRLAKLGIENVEWIDAPLKWGEWVVKNKIISHKGEFYLRYYPLPNTKVNVTYLVDGKLATEDQAKVIKSYIASKSTTSAKQDSVGINGKNQVMCRSVKFSGVNYLHADHQHYTKGQGVTKVA